MATPTLIYCGGGNRRLYEIARDVGFQYGAQLPDTIYGPLFFADQDWRKPNRIAYMSALAEYKPHMATVLDWEYEDQLTDVLDWAEEAAQYVERVVIIPKVMDGVGCLPRQIGSKPVVLGYSVPTRYAGTELPIWSFRGWPVHLLGGSPHRQMHIWHYLSAEVVSVDGNMTNLMATRHNRFWAPGNGPNPKHRWWPALQEADNSRWGIDAPYEAFRRSCENIYAAWQNQV